MNILLFDVETTGLKPQKSFILSNGALLYNTETGKTSEFYEVLNWKQIMSNFYIPEDTIAVHGITENEMISSGIHPLTSMSNFYNWIKDFTADNSGKINVCVAFNLPFDLNMYVSNLKYLVNMYCKNFAVDSTEAENCKELLNIFTKDYSKENTEESDEILFIDSMIVDQIFHFEVDGEKVYHNLDAVGNRYGLLSDPNAHNAIADTRRMFEVFKIQLQEIENKGLSLNQKFENRLIKRFNRNNDLWKKKDSLDYLATNMKAASL